MLEAKQSARREALDQRRSTLFGSEAHSRKLGHARRGSRGWDRVMGAAYLFGPYLLGNIYVSRGERVTIAYVEGQEGKVTLLIEASDAVWRSKARSIEQGWSRMPPSENWVSHQAYRRVIDGFPANHGNVADARPSRA